ncbi:hypothetical protein M408DRAFT_31159, partial [Serendipita vermifera MAFF 305830]
MDPHARSFTLARERARLNPLPDDMVVSDSDPETSNMLNVVTKKGASHTKTRPKKQHSTRISTTDSIIELSDDSSRQPSIAGIIELTDDSDSQEDHGRVHSAPRQPPKHLPAPPRSSTINVQSIGNTAFNGNDSDSETPSINLSRFAFTAKHPQPKPLKATTSPLLSIRESLPPNSPIARMIHSVTDSFIDEEVDRLSRCVACGIAWTTKKTVPKKRHHMRLCQKKNDLTDDTIRVLVGKELAVVIDEGETTKGKGKSKEKGGPHTLMND